ncbi:MAG: MFS transporter [Isosphaeraceae bacterium]
MRRSLPPTLLFLTLAHALVDTYAAMIQPLWPDLQRSLAISDFGFQLLFICWSLATSVSQIVFGIWGDRRRGGVLLWIGAGVGIAGISLVGLPRSTPLLGAWLVASGLGIAAFHPEAAAWAGATTPADRSRALSLFAVGGYLGMAVGPVVSGALTTHQGLGGLRWCLVAGLVLLVLVAGRLGRAPSPHFATSMPPHDDPHEPRPPEVGPGLDRRSAAVLVVVIGVLRTLPMTGVPLALAYWIKGQGGTNEQVGWLQALFAVGIGCGSLGCALALRETHERRALWLLPVLASPLALVCPLGNLAWSAVCVAGMGLLMGAAIPMLTGYGQRLLHDAQRVASALTMGVTWGLGGVLVAALMAALNHIERPGWAFPAFAVASVASGLLCLRLPDLRAASANVPVSVPATARATSATTARH